MTASVINGQDDDAISISSAEFSDSPDFVDDISDSELIPELCAEKPVLNNNDVSCVIIVDGLPVVGPEKLEKLKNVVKSRFSKFGEIIDEYIPLKNGNTTGYFMYQYQAPQHAVDAVNNMNLKPLDRQHTFLVNVLTDYEKSISISTEWTPPPKVEYKDVGNLKYYLLDELCRDQFVVLSNAGSDTAVYLNSLPEPQLLECRKRWTEAGVRWSTRGTYLATTHARGIALWGGEKFSQIMKFPHYGVSFIDFSPCERYMVTFSNRMDSTDDSHAIVVWDAVTGIKGRGFQNEAAARHWPIFKWSHDDKYFARNTEDMISVYETPTYGLLEKKSIKIPLVEEFSWSPTDNIIAYWVPELDNSPARVVLMEIPSRKEICTKNLFSVAKIDMIWQANGDFLCVLVERYAKKKFDADKQVKYIGTYINFEIFRIREKQIPVEKLDVKDMVTKICWEPNGNRFAYITNDPATSKTAVAFYDVRTGRSLDEMKLLDRTGTKINELHWSPKGQYIVLAGLKSGGGYLEFVDATDVTSIIKTEHLQATELQWDPTGRYVATYVAYHSYKADNGIFFWSCTGRLLCKLQLDKLMTFSWRPRPPTLLPAKKLKDIKKSMKKYTAKFEMEDKMLLNRANKELMDKRRNQFSEFRQWRQNLSKKFDKEKPKRLEMRGVDTDVVQGETDLEEESIEFLVSLVTTLEKKNYVAE